MFPGLNPKKMQAMMKQMGFNQEDIDAKRVIIEKENNNIIINNPSVTKINMQRQTSFQITGDISEGKTESEENKAEEDKSEQDIKTIMEKANCLEQEAKLAYEKANHDLTEAIISLS